MGELVSLETLAMGEQKNYPEDDSVDFVAATTAALGVPSPCLSRGQSFDDSPQKAKKGDIEEETELLRVLKLSEAEKSGSVADDVVEEVNLGESAYIDKPELEVHSETVEKNIVDETLKTRTLISDNSDFLSNHNVDKKLPEVFAQEDGFSFSMTDRENSCTQSTEEEFKKCCGSAINNGSHPRTENVNAQHASFGEVPPSASINFQEKSWTDVYEFSSTSDLDAPAKNPNEYKGRDSSSLLATAADLDSSDGRVDNKDKPQAITSSVDGSEPIYEGEECIMSSGPVVCDNQEPVYEGEVVLAEQVDTGYVNDAAFKDRISIEQGEVLQPTSRWRKLLLSGYFVNSWRNKVMLFNVNFFSYNVKYRSFGLMHYLLLICSYQGK